MTTEQEPPTTEPVSQRGGFCRLPHPINEQIRCSVASEESSMSNEEPDEQSTEKVRLATLIEQHQAEADEVRGGDIACSCGYYLGAWVEYAPHLEGVIECERHKIKWLTKTKVYQNWFRHWVVLLVCVDESGWTCDPRYFDTHAQAIEWADEHAREHREEPPRWP